MMITPQQKTQQGFTIVELLITVGILAILSAFAVPTFVKTMNKTKFNGEVNAIAASFQEARTNAVLYKRQHTAVVSTDQVSISPVPTGKTANDVTVALKHAAISPARSVAYDYMGRADINGANNTNLGGHCFALTHKEDASIVASILVQAVGTPNIFKNTTNCQ